jgi:hypothetical protein
MNTFVDTKMTATLRSWKGEERPTAVAKGPDLKRSVTCMRAEERSVGIGLLAIYGGSRREERVPLTRETGGKAGKNTPNDSAHLPLEWRKQWGHGLSCSNLCA